MSSDTSTTRLSYKKEQSFATLPAAAAFKRLRFTGESLTHKKATIQSNEIRSDRQVADLVQVGASADGSINFELSLLEYLELIAAVMGQTAWDDQGFTGSAQIDGSGLAMAVENDIPAGFISAGYVKISGASNAANNGIKRLTGRTGVNLQFAPGEFVQDQDTFDVTVERAVVANGVDMSSFTFERAVLSDAGYVYQSYAGMTPSGMNLRIGSMEMVTGSFNFVGKAGSLSSRSLSRAGETAATGTLTLTGQPSAGNGCVIGVGTGQKTYVFTSTTPTAAGAGSIGVKIGATASDTIDNLVAAINGEAGAGIVYSEDAVAHTQVTAANGAGDTMVVTAKLTEQTGTFGNTIVTTETMNNATWGAGTLSGGVDANEHLDSTTESVVNGSNNVVSIASGTGQLSDPAKSLAITINNNVRAKDKIGEAGAFEMGQGQFQVTGTIEAYFESNDLYRQIVEHDDVSLALLLQDDDGNALGITFPRVKLSDGTPNTGANNQDVMMTVNFTAIQDPASGVTMIVDSFPA